MQVIDLETSAYYDAGEAMSPNKPRIDRPAVLDYSRPLAEAARDAWGDPLPPAWPSVSLGVFGLVSAMSISAAELMICALGGAGGLSGFFWGPPLLLALLVDLILLLKLFYDCWFRNDAASSRKWVWWMLGMAAVMHVVFFVTLYTLPGGGGAPGGW